MIRYKLVCDQGHAFEGWFRDSAAFDEQAARGLLACAICGSARVGKAIMAPAVARRDQERPAASESTARNPGGGARPVALMDDDAAKLRAAIKALRDHIEATAENVGPAFAEIARDMHEGLIDHKPIYGVATPDEIAALKDDGIEAWPLPALPDERN